MKRVKKGWNVCLQIWVLCNAEDSGRQEFKNLGTVCSHIQHILLVKNSNMFSAEFVDVKCMPTHIPLSTFNYEDIVNTPFYSDRGRDLMEE